MRTIGPKVKQMPYGYESKRSWKQRFRDWLNDSGEVEQDCYAVNAIHSQSKDYDRGINFKVFKASGGTIIETNFYDRVKDKNHQSLHVITDEKDIGKEIGKIITIEALKI